MTSHLPSGQSSADEYRTDTQWNFADVWEQAARSLGSAPAQEHGVATWTWHEFDKRANGVAAALLSRGITRQDKFAQYLYNGPQYLESLHASFKIGMVPVNTNYRYTDDELVYLWDNSDAVAVVFHATFTDTIQPRGSLSRALRGTSKAAPR